jgi:hypothetical protein
MHRGERENEKGRPKVSLKSKEFRFVSYIFAMAKEDASINNSTNSLNVKAAHFRDIYAFLAFFNFLFISYISCQTFRPFKGEIFLYQSGLPKQREERKKENLKNKTIIL